MVADAPISLNFTSQNLESCFVFIKIFLDLSISKYFYKNSSRSIDLELFFRNWSHLNIEIAISYSIIRVDWYGWTGDLDWRTVADVIKLLCQHQNVGHAGTLRLRQKWKMLILPQIWNIGINSNIPLISQDHSPISNIQTWCWKDRDIHLEYMKWCVHLFTICQW